MKKATRIAGGLVCGLCLTLVFYQCTPPKEEPSNDYLFKDLRSLKMPEAQLRLAAQIPIAPASVTRSPLLTAVSREVAAIPTTNQVSSAVSQAITATNQALSAGGTTANQVLNALTPEVITALTNSGQMTAPVQTLLTTLRNQSALQSYSPAFTYPQVAGQSVTPTTTQLPTTPPPTVTPAVVLKQSSYTGSDPCYRDANGTFDRVTQTFNTDRSGLIATITATYDQAKTAAENDVSGCGTNTISTYRQLKTTAQQELNTNLNNLVAARSVLGDAGYASLAALTLIEYATLIAIYDDLQKAELNACVLVRDARIAAALLARDSNISVVNENFNTAVRQAQALVLDILDSCHNQGSGR